MKPELSIIIPQYKTEQFIRLCLRSLRKYSCNPIQVIVVDNNSCDGSIDYLRKVAWIDLIENKSDLVGIRAHREAIDLGVEKARGDWICLFHSDTIVLKEAWDVSLLGIIKKAGAAGLSTYIRDVNQFENFFIKCSRRFCEFRTGIKRKINPNKGKDKIMSYCLFIKRTILSNSGFIFSKERMDVGSELYHEHIKDKYPFVILRYRKLSPFFWHTSNVTSIITGQIAGQKDVSKFNSKLRELQENENIKKIMSDNSLDL